MTPYFLIALAILPIAAAAVFLLFSRKNSRTRRPSFVCDRCGEHHCDCRLEDSGKGH